jgi:membrane protease YdiL (CAAX protease family)
MQLALVLAVMAVVGVSAFFGFQLTLAGAPMFWVLLGLPHVALAAFALWRMHRDGELRSIMRPVWGDFSRGFFLAAFLFMCAYGFSKVVSPTGSARESWMARIYLQLGHPGTLRSHAVMLAAWVIAVAAGEEIVWRGLVTTLFAERFGSRFAWIAAAVAYAAAHVPTMWALADPVAGLNPVLPLAALGAGLVWGVAARSFGRLPPVIVAHALFDWCVIVMFRLWGNSL